MPEVNLSLGSFEYVAIINTIFVLITKNFWHALFIVISLTRNEVLKSQPPIPLNVTSFKKGSLQI